MPASSDRPNDYHFEKIPERIIAARKQILRSQRATARWAGVPRGTYQRIESGKKSPTLEGTEDEFWCVDGVGFAAGP